MITDTHGVGHDGQRRIHRAARREEAAVDDIEIVEVVRLAVHIECRVPRIAAEAGRPALMGRAADRDILAEIERARQDTGLSVHRLQYLFELLGEADMSLHVILG